MGVIDRFYIGKAIDSFLNKGEEESFIGDPLEGEDGGHGSGNWGHKGRPGLRGGSGNGKEGWTEGAGKGYGGKQYRGGNETNYYSSKNDWLNGLNGERQHEIQKWMESKGKNLAEQEENILTSGKKDDILKMLKAKAEARKFDGDYYVAQVSRNLSEEEKKILNKAMLYGTDNTDKVSFFLSGARNPEEYHIIASVLNKAMGGKNYWEGAEPLPDPAPKPSPKPAPQPVPEPEKINTDWVNNNNHADYALKALWHLAGEGGYNIKGPNDIIALEQKLSSKDFCNPRNLSDLKNYLMYKSEGVPGFKDSVLNGEGAGKELHDILVNYGLDTLDNVDVAEARLKTLGNLNEYQEYLYKKSKALGGATITAPLAKHPAEVVKSIRTFLDSNPNASTSEICKVLDDSGVFAGGYKANISSVAPECARSFANSYMSLIDSYPFMSGRLEGIDEKVSSYNAYASCSYKMGGAVHVNPTWFKNPAKAKAQYEDDLKSGFHPAGTTWESIVDHELAHALDGWLYGGGIGDKKKANPWSFAWETRDVSATVLSATAKALKMKIYDCKSAVSKYALKEYPDDKTCEWLAECLAEARTSKNPRPVALECEKQLKLLIEKRKRGL